MRAILIDPFTETVAELDLAPGLDALYAATDCGTIDIRSISDNGDDIVIDDEGHFRSDQRYFQLNLDPTMWEGKALIVAHDEAGNMIGTRIPLELIRDTVHFWPEGTEYEPPTPTVTSFDSFEEMAKHMGWEK